MSRYHWPSWCRSHRRPHIRARQCCLTNWDRRQLRHMIAEHWDEIPVRVRRRP